MHLFTILLSVFIGSAFAFVLHRLTDSLRLPMIVKPAAVFGWCVFSAALFFAIAVIVMWLRHIDDPGMAPLWGMCGLFLLALLGIGAWLGTIHARHYETTWAQAFGIVMARLAFVGGTIGLLSYVVPSDAMWSVFACAVSLLITFLALEFAPSAS